MNLFFGVPYSDVNGDLSVPHCTPFTRSSETSNLAIRGNHLSANGKWCHSCHVFMPSPSNWRFRKNRATPSFHPKFTGFFSINHLAREVFSLWKPPIFLGGIFWIPADHAAIHAAMVDRTTSVSPKRFDGPWVATRWSGNRCWITMGAV